MGLIPLTTRDGVLLLVFASLGYKREDCGTTAAAMLVTRQDTSVAILTPKLIAFLGNYRRGIFTDIE